MTGIFSIMLPAGYSNWTEVKEFHGKGTILPGLNRKQKDLKLRKKEMLREEKFWNGNLNG